MISLIPTTTENVYRVLKVTWKGPEFIGFVRKEKEFYTFTIDPILDLTLQSKTKKGIIKLIKTYV